jgi:two-component system alkaline phosphatase synthesis response regulator PhoP
MLLKGKKILVIEDDAHMRRGLQDNLEFEGYEVYVTDSGEEGLRLYQKHSPNLIILDVMLTGIDGIEVCRKLRAEKKHVPIIMLSVRSSEVDKVLGLETGADDYMTKPFGLKELVARIKVVLRRFDSRPPENVYKLDDIEVDLIRQEVRRKGVLMEFTAKEFDLLKYFLENNGKPLSRELLLEQVWGQNVETTTRTVDTHVLKLRKKLEKSPDSPHYFLTIYGVGYKFKYYESQAD